MLVLEFEPCATTNLQHLSGVRLLLRTAACVKAAAGENNISKMLSKQKEDNLGARRDFFSSKVISFTRRTVPVCPTQFQPGKRSKRAKRTHYGKGHNLERTHNEEGHNMERTQYGKGHSMGALRVPCWSRPSRAACTRSACGSRTWDANQRLLRPCL
jgi:hypothetical protein